MFKSLFQPKKSVFDPALGDRLAKTILSEARQGKVDTLSKKLDELRTGEWDRRAFYLDLAAEHMENTENIEKLPDTATSNLIKGTIAIHDAWRARGSGQAETVTSNGWDLFHKHLDSGGKYFLRAAEQDPADPTPFGSLQTIAMGLQLDRKIAQAWLDEAIMRDPLNQHAHYAHLFLLCKKWSGSHEEMYAFARSTANKAPVGSLLHSIIYMAFQEHFLYLIAFENNKPGANELLNNKNVQEESMQVYANSLGRRRSIERVCDYWPHNVAIWWFMALSMVPIVRQETKKVGPYFTKYPWGMFFRNPADGYERALKL